MSSWPVREPSLPNQARIETIRGDYVPAAEHNRGFPVVLVVVDLEFRVVLSPFRPAGSGKLPIPHRELFDEEQRQVHPALHNILRQLRQSAEDSGAPCRAVIPPRYVISVMPLNVIGSALSILTIEAARTRENLDPAVAPFALTRRETQILALILDGASASQMAALLNLAESTIQTYFKRLLEKTSSPNRYAMVAKILGWQVEAR